MNHSRTPGQFGHCPGVGEYLRERQIVRPHGILPISRSCFREYVRQGRIAPGILLSPRVRVWARAEVLAFVEAR